MSVFYVTIAVGDPNGERFEDIQALADTGATLRLRSGQAWTWVPGDVLERLGHRPTLKRRLQTADKRIIDRDAGIVPIRIGAEVIPNICIFGDPGSQALLGATTLESFSLTPDAVNERLVPVVGMLMTLLE